MSFQIHGHKMRPGPPDGSAICECSLIALSSRIGARTKVWHFCNIMEDVRIGDDCSISSYVQIDPHTRIGDRVRIQPYSAGVAFIGNDVFIGTHVVMVDAKYPPGKPAGPVRLVIGDGAFIGSHSVLLPVKIGSRSVVSSNSLVSKDVPPDIWVGGSPARVIGSRRDYEKKREEWNRT